MDDGNVTAVKKFSVSLYETAYLNVE